MSLLEDSPSINRKAGVKDRLHNLCSKLCGFQARCDQRDKVSLFGRNKHVQARWRETTFPDQYARHCTVPGMYSPKMFLVSKYKVATRVYTQSHTHTHTYIHEHKQSKYICTNKEQLRPF